MNKISKQDIESNKRQDMQNNTVKGGTSAVVVWFNPQNVKNIFDNIKSYSRYMRKVYIVDNSDENNSNFLRSCDIDNAVYIPLMGNAGIARALNIGVQKAFDDGAEWCMTMDQDSSWNENELKKYLSAIEEHKAKAVSFAPKLASENYSTAVLDDIIRVTKHFIKYILKPFLSSRSKTINKTELAPDWESVDTVFTSGNVISLKTWNDMNWECNDWGGVGFNEDFFIDEVDHDFCFRLREKSLAIIKFNNIYMHHELGIPKKTFYKCFSYHKRERIYYIARNILFMMKIHPFYTEKHNYKDILNHRFKEIIFNIRLGDLKYFIQGIQDGKKGIGGKYKHRKNKNYESGKCHTDSSPR